MLLMIGWSDACKSNLRDKSKLFSQLLTFFNLSKCRWIQSKRRRITSLAISTDKSLWLPFKNVEIGLNHFHMFLLSQKGQDRADSSSATVKAMFHDDQAEVLIERSESKPRHGVNCVNQGCQSNTEGGTCEKTAFLVPNQQQQKRKKGRADFIDKISRGLFPLIFFTFNIAYWCFYLLIVSPSFQPGFMLISRDTPILSAVQGTDKDIENNATNQPQLSLNFNAICVWQDLMWKLQLCLLCANYW